MRRGCLSFAVLVLCGFISTAHANWEYSGVYVGDGAYQDDGSRFVLSFRAGASMGLASVKNQVGTLATGYWYNESNNTVITDAYYQDCIDKGQCSGYVYAGIADLADVPVSKNFSSFSFAAGASVGWTIPNTPQWRIELGWDTIQKSEYNASPLFEGEVPLVGGDVSNVAIYLESSSLQSEVTTDVISAMAFYDFYDGLYKPTRKAIPYVGFGIGYADTKTVMNLADLYGDLSTDANLINFGKVDSNGILQFNRSEVNTANIAGVLAAGFSYGINDTLFLDLGARLTYIPKIKWALVNEDDTNQRDWISADNLIYANIMLGVRFEF